MREELLRLGEAARRASRRLMTASSGEKDAALEAIAAALEANAGRILAANAEDLANGRANGMPANLLDRMLLDEKRLTGIVTGVRQVAALKDPIGEVIHADTPAQRPDLSRSRVPLGVVGMIYEARPNVTVDAAALCLKVRQRGDPPGLEGYPLLQPGAGGGDAPGAGGRRPYPGLHRPGHRPLPGDGHRVYADERLSRCADPPGRRRPDRLDGEERHRAVIETGTGNCHVYLDKDADPAKAIPVLLNAKTPAHLHLQPRRKSLLIHRAVAETLGREAVAAPGEGGHPPPSTGTRRSAPGTAGSWPAAPTRTTARSTWRWR